MAAVVRVKSFSEESSDDNDLLLRLHTLFLECVHAALANYFDQTLLAKSTTLAGEMKNVDHLNRRKVITKSQYVLLSGTESTSDLDIMLIICLIRHLECFKLNKMFDWNELPEESDTSIEADICRVEFFWNEIKHKTSVKQNEFKRTWKEIKTILLRINKVSPIADFEQMIEDIQYKPLIEKQKVTEMLQTAESKKDEMVEQYQIKDTSSNIEEISENIGTTYEEAKQIGKLVNQEELDKLCQSHNRKDKLVVKCCESICNMIESSSEYIIHVYAAYKEENERKIYFVVIVRGDFDLNEHEIRYRMMKRNYGDLSTEGIDINSSKEETEQTMSADEHKKLCASISKNSGRLMDNHRYLNVISGSIVRSKNYKPGAMCLSKESCMALYVLVKGFIPIEENAFQKTYDGVSVDIREGLFFPYGMAGEYHDNIKMGCMITRLTESERDRKRGGTLGGFIDHQKYGLCGISCAHAMMFPDELKKCVEQNGEISWPQILSSDIVCQPDPFAINKIGRIVQAIYKTGNQSEAGVEVALIQIEDRPPISGDFPNVANVGPNEMIEPFTYETGKTCGETRFMGKDLYKFGCISDLTKGRIKTTPASVKHSKLKTDEFRFQLYNQLEIKTKNFAMKGDSGSLVFCKGMSGDYECIGMVEGGTSYGTFLITPIQSILDALKVFSLKNFKTESSRFDAFDRKLDSMSSMLEQMVQRPTYNCNVN